MHCLLNSFLSQIEPNRISLFSHCFPIDFILFLISRMWSFYLPLYLWFLLKGETDRNNKRFEHQFLVWKDAFEIGRSYSPVDIGRHSVGESGVHSTESIKTRRLVEAVSLLSNQNFWSNLIKVAVQWHCKSLTEGRFGKTARWSK